MFSGDRTVQAILGNFCRSQDSPRFVAGFGPLTLWNRVSYDTSSRLHMQYAVLDQAGTDGDGQVHVAIEFEIPTAPA